MTYSSEGIPSHRLVITPMKYWRHSQELCEVRPAVSAAQSTTQLDPILKFQLVWFRWASYSVRPNPTIWAYKFKGLGQRRKRNQRYNALMSTDPNMTGNPNLKNCQNEME